MVTKVKLTREQKIVNDYAHDYRDMTMSESDLADYTRAVIECVKCDHECTSECRRSGCNCDCGEYHIADDI